MTHCLRTLLLLVFASAAFTRAHALEQSSNNLLLEKYHPVPAPRPSHLLLKKGDRLAICGDSITEQKMYSRLMEDYLTMCVPELQVTVRQYGWSGEKAPGFLARMTNDCLRFKPTVATTCYGMNDHEYRPYEERIGQTYRANSDAIIEAFKANHVRVVLGSPGCVGKMPGWVKTAKGTVEDLNLNLCKLRNIDIELARQERVGFADVFWPMLTAGIAAQKEYGTNYAIAGKDGVHPAWAGHAIMAYAFLKGLGLSGDIGTLKVNLSRGTMKSSTGHEVLAAQRGEFTIRSSRYPFCPEVPAPAGRPPYPACGDDAPGDYNSIVSATGLVPFNQDLNRFMLVANNGHAASYKVSWGNASRSFSAAQLARGINLAAEFPCNPFSDAFAKVDAAVAAKEAFETEEIKKRFRSREAKADPDKVAAECEAEREPLAAAIQAAFQPVTHTITIVPE